MNNNRDFLWCRNETAFWVDFNESQAAQSFSAERIKRAVNQAYNHEVNVAKNEGSRNFFLQTYDFTWEADEQYYALAGTPIKSMDILAIHDITEATDGIPLEFNRHPLGRGIGWFDRNKLIWGAAGPSSDKDLRVLYLASAGDMVGDADEPDLIPYDFRDIIPISAAILLRDVADEGHPGSWDQLLLERRYAFWKYIQARPRSDGPRVASMLTADAWLNYR